MKTIFESDNILFVEVSGELIGDYLAMVNDHAHVNRFIGGTRTSYTREQEARWVRAKLDEKAPVFSMIERKSGEFIGNVELMDADGTEGELGIAITAGKQDRGFGTEAVRAMTAYALDRMGLERVFLRTRPWNARAIRVYEKCGFREYAREGEHVFMEILREKRPGKGEG